MIKFNESRLPEQAREKLLMLDAARVEQAAAAAARLPYEVQDAKIMQRVHQSQERHAQRHNEIHALCSRIRQFLNSLPANVTFEPADPVNAMPRKGETLAQAIERLRSEIADTHNHLDVVKGAPLPVADIKALCRARVKAMAARPRVWVGARGEFAMSFVDAQRIDTLASLDDIAAMLAFADPESFSKRLEDEIDRQLGDQTLATMPKGERERRTAELAEQLLELERQEEALIDSAQAQGQDIPRRENADPRAVLQITVAAKQRAQEAA
jgi:hypothetical protein